MFSPSLYPTDDALSNLTIDKGPVGRASGVDRWKIEH